MRIDALVDLRGLAELAPGIRRSQPLSSMRSGRVESRRDSCSTLSMIVLTRSPLLVMMSVSRRSCVDSVGDFGQQLRGVAHRADRVADLVRDAGAEPAERGELRLLHALDDQRRVLEEDQRRSLAAAVERHEVRLDQAAAVGGEQRQRAELPVVRVAAPRVEQVQQARRDLAERRARLRSVAPCSSSAADSLISRIVSFASTTRMLSRRCCTMNWLSSARLATSTSRWRTRSSLSRRLRASGPTPSVTMNMSAPTMPAEAKSPASPRAASVVSVCCSEQGERRDRGEHQRETLPHDEARRTDRQHQQRREAAVHAAARVGEQRDREHVDARR